MQKIMFNDRYGLTQAVIEGRKTMTRRLIPWDLTEQWMEFVSDAPNVGGVYVHESEKDFYEREAPRYKVGEIVAVAQRYEDVEELSYLLRDPFSETYFEEVNIGDEPGYRNKMFVKSELMPHQIRITGIKCERLQDISDAECLKEGVRVEFARNGMPMYYYFNAKRWREMWFDTPRDAFTSLIDKVSGRGTWGRNPWVVAYEFELVK